MTRAQALADLLGDGRAQLGAPVLLPGAGRIPKPYALARLLEHGRMTRDQLLACTRWASDELDHCLQLLCSKRLVRRVPFGFAGLDMFEAVAA